KARNRALRARGSRQGASIARLASSPAPRTQDRMPQTFRLARFVAAALIAVSLPCPAGAQAPARGDSTPASGAPDLGPMRTIEFDTDQGTWMNLDVSPDGRTILFDLLGDIYTMPIGGGTPSLLSGGRSWDQMRSG